MDAQQDALIGTLVAGRYRMLEALGEGGMGVVYLAEHELIKKRVALKVLRHQYSMKSDLVTRFQQEAISASRIKHPNVLDVFDFGQLENGCFFLAMEYLAGHDLGEELADYRVIAPRRGTYIAIQMCRALAAAHARGVVHRDMKPENVFLHRTDEGEEIIKIVDFGIAQLRPAEQSAETKPRRRRLTQTGMIFGTPEYMAPEQASGEKPDLRLDIYAVGIILYEMFTGSVPFSGESFMGVLNSHANDPLRPMADFYADVEASVELQATIAEALRKNPDERFQSMGELAHALLDTPEGQSLGLHQQPPIPIVNAAEFVPSFTPIEAGSASHFLGRPSTPDDMSKMSRREGPITAIAGTPNATSEANTVAPTSTLSSRRRWWLPVGFVALLAAGGTIYAVQQSTSPTQQSASGDAPATSVSTSPKSAPSPNPIATVVSAPPDEASKTELAEEKRIRLSVRTSPPGATVLKDGFQVCDATPCEVVVDKGESMTLKARLGPQHGAAKVLAQQDQTVTIALRAKRKTRPVERPAPAPKLCEVEADGLKILRPCR